MAIADFTVADVLAWARTKPADERYDYTTHDNCALCQFLRETGRAAAPSVLPRAWAVSLGEEYRRFSDDLEDALKPAGPCFYTDTFGNLAKRLEALAPETPITRDNWAAIDAYLTDIEQVSA